MITARYAISSVSPGSMLREEKAGETELGCEADEYTRHGKLVPDAVVTRLVACCLEKHNGRFISDGYPHTIGQAEALQRMLDERNTPLDVELFFSADFPTLRARVQDQCICSKCSRNFSFAIREVEVDAPCPVCGAKLVRRSDDTLETLAVRMEEYEAKSASLVGYFSERDLLKRTDVTKAQDKWFESVIKVLEVA